MNAFSYLFLRDGDPFRQVPEVEMTQRRSGREETEFPMYTVLGRHIKIGVFVTYCKFHELLHTQMRSC